jgi:hypothetical protein
MADALALLCLLPVLLVLQPVAARGANLNPPPTGPRPPAPPMPRAMAVGPSGDPSDTGRNDREIGPVSGPRNS